MSTQPPQLKKNYKDSLNLPQTAFPMEAKLTANEPARLKKWQEARLYEKLMAARAHSPKGKWILHDGPPFANGDIHIGHLINKTLKDVILRFRSMQGYQAPYVPGWDCHGLPIEHKIQETLGPKLRDMSPLEVRKLCFEYAEKYSRIQSEQFQRLGILGDWANPYLTMKPGYEAESLEVFARFVEAGLVYKKLKPVAWSIENRTALADAELEYKDVTDNSVFVEFPLTASSAALLLSPSPGTPGEGRGGGSERRATLDPHPNPPPAYQGREQEGPIHLLVWTTTPWTLPANLAVAVHPNVQYAFVKYHRDGQSRRAVIAADLAEKVLAKHGSFTVEKTVVGSDLNDLKYQHPFLNRQGRVVLAEYVTTTDGTGLVHTAPGHGEDDYETGIREKLDVYSPVLADGKFDDTAPDWLRGKKVWEANQLIIDRLRNDGLLFAEEKITHSYPHDWRSRKPIIFRATEQWFVAMDQSFNGGPSVRERALTATAKQIDFVPQWGKARLVGMLESRPDWCISRQRVWGLPIPVFYNDKGDALLTPQSVRAVAKRFAEKGSDAWFSDSPAELLGKDFRYPPGFSAENLRKEKDIFDVWWESGSSWKAVLQARPELQFPADLYLEGSDQHRGWFQLSLLPCLGATGQPPFKQALTHGFVVKPDGTKVSKSDKEYVTATQEVNRHGADVLRLWCCSMDYQNDIPTSPAAIQEFGDKYRKIRNTLKFLLGNLYDFNSPKDEVAIVPVSLDGWAWAKTSQLVSDVEDAYTRYQLHRAFRLLHDFCAVDVSTIYSTAMKDRLYCELPNSPRRRRCQTVMNRMASVLTRLLAPMLVFTSDEAWEHFPNKNVDEWNVHLARWPKPSTNEPDAKQIGYWKILMHLRDEATAQLDKLKKEKGMNKALDAELVFSIPDKDMRNEWENSFGSDLEDLVGAGFHTFNPSPIGGPADISVEVLDRREKYKACARSWKRRPDVGQDANYPDLSLRDADAVRVTEKRQI